MGQIPFSGYNGSVWAVALASMEYLAGVIPTTKNYVTIVPIINATLQTLLNGVDTINLFNYYNSWQIELNNFQEIISLPLSYTVNSQIVAQNRRNTFARAIEILGFDFTTPRLDQVAINLQFGKPAIDDPQLLEFCASFSTEPNPPGLTPTNFHASVQTMADAFGELAASIAQSQGLYLTAAYDVAVRQQNLTQIQANLIAQFSSGIANIEIGIGTAFDIQYIWNQLVVLPTILKDAELIGNAPYLENVQQALIQKFVMLTMAQNLALFLLSIQQPLTQNINLATVKKGQTLMDIAASKLQNFEKWQAIAQTNQLRPPWVVQSSEDPSVAQWGQQLVMPGSQSGIIGTPPSYLNNFLGVDLYLGTLGQDMLSWTGDFQTIAGYENLQISLSRRVLTAIGSLIYHSTYGSEIPLLIGTIASQAEAAYITALAQAALLSDPRVKQVLKGQTLVQNDFAFSYTGTVIPNGLTEKTILINEVLT